MAGLEDSIYPPLLYGTYGTSQALIQDIYSFPRIVKDVITFITKYDNPSPPELQDKRKVFVGGGSLGGWTSLEYGLNPTANTAGIISWVPPPKDSLFLLASNKSVFKCRMIYTVGESTPDIL